MARWWRDFAAEATPEELTGDGVPTVRRWVVAQRLCLWWDGDRPVSMAGYAGPVAGVARVAPVYTPPEYRRRGYGAAVTAACSAHALTHGAATVMLYTDLANPTSNSIYQRIGYRPVSDARTSTCVEIPGQHPNAAKKVARRPDATGMGGVAHANLRCVRVPTALVIQNDPDGLPARLGDWLGEAGLARHTVTPYDGSPLPDALDGYAAIVVIGGDMSAEGQAAADWHLALKALLRQAVSAGLPTLAICHGAHLLAEALGGRIGPGESGPEIGPALVAKRDVAAGDPLFGVVPFTPDVVQWHQRGIVALPPGAVLLASSPKFPNQAFRVGAVAYGLQFHIETTPDMVRRWVDRDADRLDEFGIGRERLLARLDEAHADVEDVWRPFTSRFVELALRRHRDRLGTDANGGPGEGHPS